MATLIGPLPLLAPWTHPAIRQASTLDTRT